MFEDRVLVVDDEPTIRHVIRTVLAEKGCRVEVAESAEAGLPLLEGGTIAVAMVDIVLPGQSGLQMLETIKRVSPDTEVLVMTSHASVETTIRAIREGAYDYLQKPFEDLEEIWITVQRALEKRRLAIRNRDLIEEQERKNQELSAAVLRLTSLIDAGRALAEFRSLPELFDSFITMVAQELGVDRASLMLLDERGESLRIAAAHGVDGLDVASVRVALGEGVAGTVAATGQPLLVKDTSNDPRVATGAKKDLAESFISAPVVLSIPIKSREKVLGVINVTNRRSGRVFGEEDLAYLSGLAGQAAVAIERTRHLDALQQAYQTLKTTQDQLVMSERLKTVGQMAAGVAHDFNNVLSVILARTQLLLGALDRDGVDAARFRVDLDTIKAVALQGAEIVRRTRDYTSPRRTSSRAPVDLNRVVRDAVHLTRPKWKEECESKGVRVDVAFELADVPEVSGDYYELIQVLGNLIFNAVEAMPVGGVLTFRSSSDGERVRLEVADTGVGMDEPTRQRLFEPFFTTKDAGQGLGASIVRGIVERHDGAISVRTRVREGTTFVLDFPVAEGVSEPAPPLDAEAELVGPTSILLVEDDRRVREAFEEALTMSGHRVVAAATGADALDHLACGGFDLVITDFVMTGVSGFDVAREAKKADPRVRVILTSGWTVQPDDRRLEESGIDHVLPKPCLIENLKTAVREVMARPARVGEGV